MEIGAAPTVEPRYRAVALAAQCAVLLERGWLAEQPRRLQEEVLARGRIRRYGRGDVVFRRGDPAGGLYGVVDGSVLHRFPTADHDSYVADGGSAGSWFGEPSLSGRRPRTVTVVSKATTVLLHLSLGSFDDLVAREPAHWRSFAALACRHHEHLLRLLAERRPAPPRRRLAARLLGLLDEPVSARAGGGRKLTLTQSELADMTGVSRHTVNRVLSEFAAEGVLAAAYGRIVVHELDALAAIAREADAEAS
ncbi:MAG: helix-turn-helix domain-containing protein [Alphaproteobacteria bacterium]|jgi:CRP-like cAMP-binding protein|nr:helix-turn-helix domain-containing protein [Alphaproteobacteria bacterium]